MLLLGHLQKHLGPDDRCNERQGQIRQTLAISARPGTVLVSVRLTDNLGAERKVLGIRRGADCCFGVQPGMLAGCSCWC